MFAKSKYSDSLLILCIMSKAATQPSLNKLTYFNEHKYLKIIIILKKNFYQHNFKIQSPSI